MEKITKNRKENDKALINRILTGDEKAYNELYKSYFTFLNRHFSKNILFKADAEDLAIMTLTKVFASIKDGKFNQDYAFSTYVTKTAKNLCVDYYRNKANKYNKVDINNEMEISNPVDSDGFNSKDNVDKEYIKECIGKVMDLLKPDQRYVLNLYYFEDKKLEEIATMTGININTVKTIKSRAESSMYKMLPVECYM